ncbi:MAG: gamma-glutamyl-gamma-aminobutyrate hydrolase family protein [bacterium]|nr:gamma-glutamyl-gamma-aminobutyrate hydrolase family protein [bacterium]MDE0242435.1 gamma-glutamyl-gamma-aminobutyrate hydrolase family protein [bacterium]MDE0416688.1 gamma-glutamyl-gamma-aminobutyrate hydrolase family protein [bacterium]
MVDKGPLPLIGIPCDVRMIDIHPFHAVGEKYIDAVAHGARAVPMLIPCFGEGGDLEPLEDVYAIDDLLDRVDGIFLPGSPSDVHPHHYGNGEPREFTMLDTQRDTLALPLIRRVVERQVPLLAVCRGIQELNVALGGTLHMVLDEVDGLMAHRVGKSKPRDEQYQLLHDIDVVAGGTLHSITKLEHYRINSVHGQGIDRLAADLAVEATAPDGLIEAVSVRRAPVMQLGVQWHPEWRFRERAYDHALFTAFGDACRDAGAATRRA